MYDSIMRNNSIMFCSMYSKFRHRWSEAYIHPILFKRSVDLQKACMGKGGSFDSEEARARTAISEAGRPLFLGGLRLGVGVGAEGAGRSEGVDVGLALDAVALVLLQAPPQRLHVAGGCLSLLRLVSPDTTGHRSRWRRRRRCFHGGFFWPWRRWKGGSPFPLFVC